MRTILALAIVTGTVASMQEPPKTQVSVEGRYETPGGSVIETLGACRIGTPDSVSCWDMAGKPDDELKKQVVMGLISSNQEINFRFGQEIRCVVVRRPQRLSLNYQSASGNHMNTMYVQRGSDEKQLDLLFPRLESGVASFDLLVNLYNVEPPKSVDVPFKVGERFRLGGAEFEVGAATLFKVPKPPQAGGNISRWNGGMPPFHGTFFADSKVWIVGIGHQKLEDRSLVGAIGTLDKEGRMINYVNKDGEPIPATEVLANQPPTLPGFPSEPNAKPPKYRPVMVMNSGSDVAGAMGFAMNVNPARVGKLRIFEQSNRMIRFKNIPLDVKMP